MYKDCARADRIKRRDALGTIKWDRTKVSRALHNATHMGYEL